MQQDQINFVWILAIGMVALIVYALVEARHAREKRRAARVLESIELRLDKIEVTMRALPQLLLEAYNKLEERRGQGGRD